MSSLLLLDGRPRGRDDVGRREIANHTPDPDVGTGDSLVLLMEIRVLWVFDIRHINTVAAVPLV